MHRDPNFTSTIRYHQKRLVEEGLASVPTDPEVIANIITAANSNLDQLSRLIATWTPPLKRQELDAKVELLEKLLKGKNNEPKSTGG